MRNLLIIVWAGLFVSVCCFSQGLNNEQAEQHVQQGIQNIYSLQFDRASSEFQEVVRLVPDHPAGYFFLATAEWWRILIDMEDRSHDQQLLQWLDKTIEMCDARLKKNDYDLVGLFYKSGAVGFRLRLHGNRKEYVNAANDARMLVPLVQKCYKISPNNGDVLFSMGLYNYYAATIPQRYPFLKPSLVFLPSGSKPMGIMQLRQAADRATYSHTEAAYFLIQLDLYFEGKPKEALALTQKLCAAFPGNPLFHRYLGKCHAALGDWKKCRETFTAILQRSQSHAPGYTASAEQEAEYYLGLADCSTGHFDPALRHLYRCDELSRSLNGADQKGTMALANLRIGMIYDAQSKRQNALAQYQKVLDWDDYWGTHQTAEQYIKSAWRLGSK